MAVYVDDMRAPFGRMIMCHLIADSRAELDTMVDKIGVARKWIQHADTDREHYDISLSMRAKAIKVGAIEITGHELGLRLYAKRQNSKTPSFG